MVEYNDVFTSRKCLCGNGSNFCQQCYLDNFRDQDIQGDIAADAVDTMKSSVVPHLQDDSLSLDVEENDDSKPAHSSMTPP